MEIAGPMGITGHLEIRDLKEIAGHVEIAGRMTQGNRIYRLTPEVERLRRHWPGRWGPNTVGLMAAKRILAKCDCPAV
jgi:hypothetical protein